MQDISTPGDEIASGAHREFSLGTVDSGTYGGAEIEIQPLEKDDSTSDAETGARGEASSPGQAANADRALYGDPYRSGGPSGSTCHHVWPAAASQSTVSGRRRATVVFCRRKYLVTSVERRRAAPAWEERC